MPMTSSYGQFCPVAMAAEIVCTRWTPLILRELLAGSTRFNELRKGVPAMSPTLLSKRLKELESAGLIRRLAAEDGAGHLYHLTESGEDLRPVIMALGFWGQRWVEAEISLKNLNPSLLMWDMRRNLDGARLPAGRCVVQFLYPEIPPAKRTWWLVVDGGQVDLCQFDPGFPVDLYVETSLRTMTAIWMGLTTVATEQRRDRLRLEGRRDLRNSMQQWLGLSPFATEAKRVGGLAAAE